MEMRELIEIAEKKAGSQIALAKMLGQFDSSIRQVKAGKKGLPDAVCIELADFLEVDRLAVIAASNLVTEKNEKRKRIFKGCIKGLEKATAMGLIIATTTILTPSPAEAHSMGNTEPSRMYIMLN
ncbi:MAG: hypothetical protein IPI97_06100 [Nitrosomonas sp.]|nr:hypothetical protein [Nitrosomonas sp.]MBK7364573.1 hypothetical protein [Nitrosomonas sp.]